MVYEKISRKKQILNLNYNQICIIHKKMKVVSKRMVVCQKREVRNAERLIKPSRISLIKQLQVEQMI